MKKTAIFLLFICIACLSFAEEKRFGIPLEGSPVYGPPDAPVTVVEFIDFQ